MVNGLLVYWINEVGKSFRASHNVHDQEQSLRSQAGLLRTAAHWNRSTWCPPIQAKTAERFSDAPTTPFGRSSGKARSFPRGGPPWLQIVNNFRNLRVGESVTVNLCNGEARGVAGRKGGWVSGIFLRGGEWGYTLYQIARVRTVPRCGSRLFGKTPWQ